MILRVRQIIFFKFSILTFNFIARIPKADDNRLRNERRNVDIHIKYTNMQSSGAVEEYVHKKIGALSKLIKDIERNFAVASDTLHVWVEVAKITRHHQKGKVFYAECQIGFPGKSIRSESTQYDLHVAIDEAKDEMQRMLKQYKEK